MFVQTWTKIFPFQKRVLFLTCTFASYAQVTSQCVHIVWVSARRSIIKILRAYYFPHLICFTSKGMTSISYNVLQTGGVKRSYLIFVGNKNSQTIEVEYRTVFRRFFFLQILGVKRDFFKVLRAEVFKVRTSQTLDIFIVYEKCARKCLLNQRKAKS